MEKQADFRAANDQGDEVVITVWKDMDGNYIPEAPGLGMGHNYQSPRDAAGDLARRHGYTLGELCA